MSEYPKDSFNKPNPHRGVTPEQIPHSGIHHDEYPVNEFDNTPLPEAVERGLVKPMPDTLAGLEQIESTEKKSHKKLVIGGAAFLAGAAVIAGSVIGIKAAGDAPKNSAPEPDSKATSQTPEATPIHSPEQQLTVQSLEIPAGLSPEQFGKTLIEDRYSAWDMAGATDATSQAIFNRPNGTTAEFTDQLAAANGKIFADALMVPGYETDPALVTEVQNQSLLNSIALQSWYSTYQSGEKVDKEPYRHWTTVDSTTLVSQAGDSTTYSIKATEHTNESQNSVGLTNPTTVDGSHFVATVTEKTIDGTAKISAIDFKVAP